MDDYIIHIYRRNQTERKELIGTVELVATQQQESFHNMEELWSILTGMRQDTSINNENKPDTE